MAARESVNLSLKADISDLKRSLGEIPGVTKKQAQAMTRELQVQYNKAQRAATKAAKKTKVAWADTARSAAMVGTSVAAAGVAVVAFGQQMADLNNELTDTATRTGLLVEQVAGLRLAGEGAGVPFAKLESGLNRLPKSMADAAKGSAVAADAFGRLGVEIENADGSLRPASEVFAEVTTSLGQMDDAALKSATAMDLFGTKAGGALVQSGALENLDAFVALATEFGVDVGPKATASAAAFQREMALLKTVSQGVAQDLLDQFGGSGGLNDAIRLSTESVILFGAVVGSTFENIADSFGMVLGPIAEVAATLSTGDFAGALEAAKRNGLEFGEGLLRTTNMVGLAATVAEGAIEGVADGLERVQQFRELTAATDGAALAPGAGGGGGAAAGGPAVAASTTETDQAIKDLDRLRAAQVKASEARLSERARIQLEFEREIDIIARAMEAGASMEEAQTAINVAQTEQLIALAELKDRIHNEDMERMDAAAEKSRQTSMAIVGDAADAVGALSGLASTAGAAMAEAGTKGAKKSAALMFGVSKALALSMIPLKLAEALMAAQSRPLPGIATATALATAASQTIAITSAKPPTFDRGGIIHGGTGDQVMAATLPGEAVLSREAVSRIGEDGVNDLNSGRGMGGGPTVVQMVYRHRVFDEFVADNMAAPTPLGQAVRGDRVTGRRS